MQSFLWSISLHLPESINFWAVAVFNLISLLCLGYHPTVTSWSAIKWKVVSDISQRSMSAFLICVLLKTSKSTTMAPGLQVFWRWCSVCRATDSALAHCFLLWKIDVSFISDKILEKKNIDIPALLILCFFFPLLLRQRKFHHQWDENQDTLIFLRQYN